MIEYELKCHKLKQSSSNKTNMKCCECLLNRFIRAASDGPFFIHCFLIFFHGLCVTLQMHTHMVKRIQLKEKKEKRFAKKPKSSYRNGFSKFNWNNLSCAHKFCKCQNAEFISCTFIYLLTLCGPRAPSNFAASSPISAVINNLKITTTRRVWVCVCFL